MSSCYILHVEDDPNDVVLVEHAFNRARLPVILQHVGDGQAAVDYLAGLAEFKDRTRYPVPGLVLLDLKLPALSGFEVLAWARKQPGLEKLPVYVLSSSDHPEDVARARELGADEYFLKTPGFVDVVEKVRTAVVSSEAARVRA